MITKLRKIDYSFLYNNNDSYTSSTEKICAMAHVAKKHMANYHVYNWSTWNCSIRKNLCAIIYNGQNVDLEAFMPSMVLSKW
jgi:hypothetical protein